MIFALAALLWLAAFVLYAFLLKQQGGKVRTAAVACGLSLVCGYVCAKGVYLALYGSAIVPSVGLITAFFRLSGIGMEMSFAGGAIGAALGVFFSGRLTRAEKGTALQAFASSGAVLVCGFRALEWLMGEQGAGDYLPDGSAFAFIPLAMQDTWGDWMISVCTLEACWALFCALWAFKRRNAKKVFRETAALLCAGQVFFDMLRTRVLTFSFVRVDQLISACILWGITLICCRKSAEKGVKKYLPAILFILPVAINALAQFLQDKPYLFTAHLPQGLAAFVDGHVAVISLLLLFLTAAWMGALALRSLRKQ